MSQFEMPSMPPGAKSKTTSGTPAARPRTTPVKLASRQTAQMEPKPIPQARERLVRDLMTENVFTLRPHDNLASLYDLMDSKHVRHVPIVDREGELVGLVTHRDLSRSALGPLDDLPLSVERDVLGTRRIRNIMAAEPDTIEPDAPLREAAEMLLENKIGCIPVAEGLHLVGILTEADFVRDFLERG